MLTDTQLQETMRRYRTTPDSFSEGQQQALAAIQGKLMAADAVGKAQTTQMMTAKAKEAAQRAEAKAKAELEATLAQIEGRGTTLPQDDDVGRAELALERAQAMKRYRLLHLALQAAEDADANAQRDLQAAEAEEGRWT